jgi:hypothetical protein
MKSKFEINAAWEIKGTSSPCRWFIVWHKVSEEEITGCVAGYCGGGSFIMEKFYAKHKNGALLALWVDFTDLISKEEIDFDSLDNEIIEIAGRAEDEIWAWNDEDKWAEDEQIVLKREKMDKLTISDDMGYYTTGTMPFLRKICELSGLTAAPLTKDVLNSSEESNGISVEIKSTMTVKELKDQLQNKYDILTPKGNIAGEDRKLRALTDMDISKGMVVKIKASENLIDVIHKMTGIQIVLTESGENFKLNSQEEVINVALSKDASNEYNTTSIGCEITIGRLKDTDIEEIISLIKEDRYFDFDSRFIANWSEFKDLYHSKGLLITNAKGRISDELSTIEEHSTENWDLDLMHIESGNGLNTVNLPAIGTYFMTVRNEDFALIGNIKLPKQDKRFKVKLYYDYFEKLSIYNSVNFTDMAIINSIKIGENSLEIDHKLYHEIGFTFPYDINQFIIHNGKIVAWFNELFDGYPKMQWQNGFEQKLPFISEFLRNKDENMYKRNKDLILKELLHLN